MSPNAARTIELFNPVSWQDGLHEVVRAHVPTRVIKHLERVRGEDMFQDTLDYLVEAYAAGGDYFGDERRAELMKAVLSPFNFFRSYHGCRPLSFDSYYREGLQPLTRERLAAIAFDLFEGTIPREEIDALSQRASLKTREGHLYFVADAGELTRMCGHYLIYGSEALCCLWRDKFDRPTPRFRESQERHRTRGIPTIFICDVPLSWIPTAGRRDLAHTLVTQYFQLESRRPLAPKDWSRNWGYSIDRSLPPEYLRSHQHPAVITDPLRGHISYRNPHRSCPHCVTPLPAVVSATSAGPA